jgi:hypothetical protein
MLVFLDQEKSGNPGAKKRKKQVTHVHKSGPVVISGFEGQE